MRHSLRKTASHLHLGYSHGDASDGLMGRRFELEVEGSLLTLSIDLTINFHTRDKSAGSYLDAAALARNHRQLRHLQCGDNLVRTRLIRAWESVPAPRLRMALDLGSRGCFVYAVQPHSLLMGGIQLDITAVLEDEPPDEGGAASGAQRTEHA
ncbi:hypothetical protein [Ramlibacter tataouinensis]|nr:hypothetical protein [Ramlibacter tataouinensis]